MMQADLDQKSTFINKFMEDNRDSIETFRKFQDELWSIKNSIKSVNDGIKHKLNDFNTKIV